MKTFTASRIADGHGLLPCKIFVGANKITVRILRLIRNQGKDISFNKIADISVDTTLMGYSTITYNTNCV